MTLTFDAGTNPDIAQVQVQNKLQLAMPQLPQEVQQQGVRVAKSVTNFLLVIGLVSADGAMSRNDIADYAYVVAAGPDQPRRRRRRREHLRRAVRHAHLARSGQAHQVRR